MFYDNIFDKNNKDPKVENSTLNAESFADSLTNSDSEPESEYFNEEKSKKFFLDLNNEIDDIKFEFLPTVLNF